LCRSPTKGRERRLNEKSNVALFSQVVACCGGGRRCLIFGGCAFCSFYPFYMERRCSRRKKIVHAASQKQRQIYIYSTLVLSSLYPTYPIHRGRISCFASYPKNNSSSSSQLSRAKLALAQRSGCSFSLCLFGSEVEWSEARERLERSAESLART
jgi:hypothetical protein